MIDNFTGFASVLFAFRFWGILTGIGIAAGLIRYVWG